MALKLRGTFSQNPRMAPMVEGAIQPKDIEVTFESGSAAELHEAHLRDSAHDVFEFSLSNYMITKERPRDLWDWVALPVFMSKATLGLNTYVHVRSGIETAADLRGKRFGVPDYTMTAGLWFRAQLRALYDIHPQHIEWFNGRAGEHAHGKQMGMDTDPPVGVKLHWLQQGQLNEMLQSGELDAAFPAGGSADVDTGTSNVRRLFDDGGRDFFASFYRKAGFLPVNHTVCVQRKLVEREPWVAEALFDAMERSKQEAYRRDPRAAGVFPRSNEDIDWQRSVFGEDPFPFGLAANRPMLEMLAQQSNVDGLTKRPADIDGLFAESLRGT